MSEKNIKTVGVDLGNANVKTSKGIIFESRVKVGSTAMNESDIKVVIDGVDYTVGSTEGALNISSKKHKKIHYKVCLLTAIAKSFKEDTINCNLVVGVPVETFNSKSFTDEIKNTINEFSNEEITINGVTKKINIHNVEVWCESGIVFGNTIEFKAKKTLVLDFGGSTVDVALWDGLRQESARTYGQGMISLYEDVIKMVNNKYGTKLNSNIAKDMINKDSYIINQSVKDISFIRGKVEEYINGLVSYINQYFPVESADTICLIGGGALQLAYYLRDEYDKAILVNNAEFANANTYERVGEMMWR